MRRWSPRMAAAPSTFGEARLPILLVGSSPRSPPGEPLARDGRHGQGDPRPCPKDDFREMEGHLDAALSAGDLDRAPELARRRIDADPCGGLDLDHALRPTELMLAQAPPARGGGGRPLTRTVPCERNPRRVEDEITDAALRGLGDPEIAGFCLRIARLTSVPIARREIGPVPSFDDIWRGSKMPIVG